MCKSDLSRAYRQLRVDPLDYPLLGIKYDGKYFTDICPSLGCRASGGSQQCVSNALVHIMHEKGHDVLAYVDDFCGVSNTLDGAKAGFDAFQLLTRDLGLAIAQDKTAAPATNMIWLGYAFDSLDMNIKIPPVKLDEFIQDDTQEGN